MDMNIGVIKGDGIGPEIVDEAMKVLDKIKILKNFACFRQPPARNNKVTS